MGRPPLLPRRVIAPAIVLVLAAACSRDLAAPATGTMRGAPRRTATADGRPQFISNTIKYRDAGARPATGRSGSSTLAARALLGKDGVTTLDVTTGSFEADAATRPLTRVQVKQLDDGGNVLRTVNHNGLESGGTASFDYAGLPRGRRLQVQGNVAEPHRTAVVTVDETVHLRPDLRAQLQAPATVVVGMPVNFVAVVSETNGEVGARADCVLYVNGIEADRARGIWVDAGDAVSCLLTHTFATVGAATVRVEAAGVNPGDFDPTNNAAEATVQVGGNSDFDYYARAEEYIERSVFTDSTYLEFDSGQRSAQGSIQHQTYTVQISEFNGWMRHGVTLGNTQIHVSQSTGGATVHSASWPAEGDEFPPVAQVPGCMSRWSEGVIFYLCTVGTTDEGFTNYQYLRDGVAVAYHGLRHDAWWWSDAPQDVWSYMYEWDGGYGYDAPQIDMGPDYSFVVEVTDGGRLYRASATVQLNILEGWSTSYFPGDGTQCSSQYVPDPGYRWDLCLWQRTDVTRRWGWTGYYTEENTGL